VSCVSIAVIGGVLLSEMAGWTGTRIVATLQALTPQLTLILIPLAGIALSQGQYVMAASAGVVGLVAIGTMAPILFHGSAEPSNSETAGLRVALANLLYGNPQMAAAASDLAGRNLDVIVFNEYTPEHQAVLLASALADDYPFKVDRSEPFAGGIAIWSRHELTICTPPATFDPSLAVSAQTTAGSLQIVAVHPRTPIYDFNDWKQDLRALAHVDRANGKALLLIGDFNATYWHPLFRHFLNTGYIDAHVAARRALSASWPTDKVIPRFVRLDHALTAGGLISTGVEDFDIPGSDHRGFVVTVAPFP